MFEPISVFSTAFTDWSQSMDTHRLSNRDRDLMQYAGLRMRLQEPHRHLLPTQAEENEASVILEEVDGAIQQRFGMDRIVSRYMLCARSIETGIPIVELATDLVKRLKTSSQ